MYWIQNKFTFSIKTRNPVIITFIIHTIIVLLYINLYGYNLYFYYFNTICTLIKKSSVEALVCRPAINAVGISYGYSLPSGRSVKLGMNEGLVPSIKVCVTMGVVGEIVGYGGGITIIGIIVETNIWFVAGEVTPTVVKVLAPSTVIPTNCSYAFGASFGEEKPLEGINSLMIGETY